MVINTSLNLFSLWTRQVRNVFILQRPKPFWMGLDRRCCSKPLFHTLATVELSQHLRADTWSLPQRVHLLRVFCAGSFSTPQYEQIQGFSSVDNVGRGSSMLPNPVERLVLDEPRPKASYGLGLPCIWLELVFRCTDLVSCIGFSSSKILDVSIMID